MEFLIPIPRQNEILGQFSNKWHEFVNSFNFHQDPIRQSKTSFLSHFGAQIIKEIQLSNEISLDEFPRFLFCLEALEVHCLFQVVLCFLRHLFFTHCRHGETSMEDFYLELSFLSDLCSFDINVCDDLIKKQLINSICDKSVKDLFLSVDNLTARNVLDVFQIAEKRGVVVTSELLNIYLLEQQQKLPSNKGNKLKKDYGWTAVSFPRPDETDVNENLNYNSLFPNDTHCPNDTRKALTEFGLKQNSGSLFQNFNGSISDKVIADSSFFVSDKDPLYSMTCLQTNEPTTNLPLFDPPANSTIFLQDSPNKQDLLTSIDGKQTENTQCQVKSNVEECVNNDRKNLTNCSISIGSGGNNSNYNQCLDSDIANNEINNNKEHEVNYSNNNYNSNDGDDDNDINNNNDDNNNNNNNDGDNNNNDNNNNNDDDNNYIDDNAIDNTYLLMCLLDPNSESNDNQEGSNIGFDRIEDGEKRKPTLSSKSSNVLKDNDANEIPAVFVSQQRVILKTSRIIGGAGQSLDVYSCNLCTFNCAGKGPIKEHAVQVHESLKCFVCTACNSKFPFKEQIDSHVRIKHLNVEEHKCQICGLVFVSQSKLFQHLQGHAETRTVSCAVCKAMFTTEKLLSEHMFNAHPNMDRWICRICGATFSVRRSLSDHVSEVHKDKESINFMISKRYVCRLCDITFTDKKSWDSHKRKYHRNKHLKRFPCNQCDHVCASKSNLISHLRTHTGEKPYMCEVCGKEFAQSSSLDKHTRTHTGEKPYKCQYCDLSFKTSSNRLVHERNHRKERPYICEQCGKTFRNCYELKSHIETHNEFRTKQFVCRCGSAFDTKRKLKRHEVSHTGQKPYKCEICDAAFTRSENLKGHQKSQACRNRVLKLQ